MFGSLQSILASYGIGPEALLMAGVAFGALLFIVGLSGSFGGGDPVLRRLNEQRSRRRSEQDFRILHPDAGDPTGLMKSLIPADEKTRTAVQRQLSAAGLVHAQSLRNFYLTRLALGVVMPLSVFAALALAQRGILPLPDRLDLFLSTLNQKQVFLGMSILIALGFFGPVWWLRDKVGKRQRAIAEAFPNALDLIQISAEAGLGFDAAMIRVGNELADTAPELSEELLKAQREIQAGRDRDRALLDMAERTGVEEVMSFANVVLQSIQYGSSIAGALSTYATAMRQQREVRAQEKANKLPVQMSAIMASLMLPALLLLALGPVVIRYMRYMAG